MSDKEKRKDENDVGAIERARRWAREMREKSERRSNAPKQGAETPGLGKDKRTRREWLKDNT